MHVGIDGHEPDEQQAVPNILMNANGLGPPHELARFLALCFGQAPPHLVVLGTPYAAEHRPSGVELQRLLQPDVRLAVLDLAQHPDPRSR